MHQRLKTLFPITAWNKRRQIEFREQADFRIDAELLHDDLVIGEFRLAFTDGHEFLQKLFITREIRQRTRNVPPQSGQFVRHRLVRGFLRRGGRFRIAVAFVEIQNSRIQLLLDGHELLADIFAGANFIGLSLVPRLLQARKFLAFFIQRDFLHAQKSRVDLLDGAFQLTVRGARLTLRPCLPAVPPRTKPIHVAAGRRVLPPFPQQPLNPFIFSMITAFADRLQIIAAIFERRRHLVVLLLVLLHLVIQAADFRRLEERRIILPHLIHVFFQFVDFAAFEQRLHLLQLRVAAVPAVLRPDCEQDQRHDAGDAGHRGVRNQFRAANTGLPLRVQRLLHLLPKQVRNRHLPRLHTLPFMTKLHLRRAAAFQRVAQTRQRLVEIRLLRAAAGKRLQKLLRLLQRRLPIGRLVQKSLVRRKIFALLDLRFDFV